MWQLTSVNWYELNSVVFYQQKQNDVYSLTPVMCACGYIVKFLSSSKHCNVAQDNFKCKCSLFTVALSAQFLYNNWQKVSIF
jgi:hypothetical protein